MQIITTHLNADFDCLASMVAAHKLYPQARLVFSGSAEKSVQEYLEQSSQSFDFCRIKDIDLEQVCLLILVDTHNPERIGAFQPLLDKPGMEVHIYDHHSEGTHPLVGTQNIIRKRGATTTLLCEILEEKKISLTPEESTLMALGIFQDTSSLLSVSTTPEDFIAIGKLVAGGADLDEVARFVHPRLNPQQLGILNQLVSNLESHNINGVEVALATASEDFYVEDVSYAVHQVMDDLRAADVDFLTIGQYLQPTPKHHPVADFVTPEQFAAYEKAARGKGFLLAAATPLTRSSYHADSDFAELARRRGQNHSATA